jgi:methylmalonyl-CoA mutase N-terminal domain/subunit
VESGERVVVGVNRFQADQEEPQQPLQVDPSIEREQADLLAELRSTRNGAECKRRLDDLRRTAEGTQNVLVPLREALRARATLGEVCDALREVWGVYQPPDAG